MIQDTALSRTSDTQNNTSSAPTPNQHCEQSIMDAEEHLHSGRLTWDVRDVVEMAQPDDPARETLANIIASHISWDLERSLVPKTKGVSQSRIRAGVKQVRDAFALTKLEPVSLRQDVVGTKLAADLKSAVNVFRPWLAQGSDKAKNNTDKHAMYPWIKQLHVYVAIYAGALLRSVGKTSQTQLVIPCGLDNVVDEDSGDLMSPDIALMTCSVDTTAFIHKVRPDYYNVFAVVEANAEYPSAKKAKTDLSVSAAGGAMAGGDTPVVEDSGEFKPKLDPATEHAMMQLFVHTRHVYACQLDVRFAWGVTICGLDTRACIFTSGGALASHTMDLHTAEGRSDYVRLLIGWHLCEGHRRGIDPTLRPCKHFDGWEIDVPRLVAGADTAVDAVGNACASIESNPDAYPKSVDPDMATYYISKKYVSADHLFGRHTRCYLATVEPGVRSASDVIIKDTWSYAKDRTEASGDLGHQGDAATDARVCNNPKAIGYEGEIGEVESLVRIKRLLESPEGSDNGLENNLPTIKEGGVVRLRVGDTLCEDSTELVLGKFHSRLGVAGMANARYVHTRIATTPICQRLRDVRSVYELVIVVADAVKAHQAIHDRIDIDILHRDISNNNIMFWRDDSGGVHGVLIDFDNAVDAKKAQLVHRPICMGTLTFMSANNLESAEVARTAVDDMESVLYLLIWKGCWGATIEHRDVTKGKQLEVAKWSMFTDEAAMSKRYRMHSNSALYPILKQFYAGADNDSDSKKAEVKEHYFFLAQLVCKLRASIFDNEGVNKSARGTFEPGIEVQRDGYYVVEPNDEVTRDMDLDGRDPFRRRTNSKTAATIYKSFVETIEDAAKEARVRIVRDEKGKQPGDNDYDEDDVFKE
ncbi:hypothetical protein IWW50_000453 [Coemansia erecta]|nr:hypothetical protein IWW50_000453 [Coemansia erecta]